jgi:GT2 family glycosyltransferase
MANALWVLIASAGRDSLLKRTLSSLAAAAKPATYRGTLVIENGRPFGAEQIVRSFAPECRFHHAYVAEANKSHALNCGLARLDDSLVFMTDDDVRLEARVLLAYDQAARRRERGAFYGGPVLIDAEHGLPPPWMRRFYSLTVAQPWSLAHQSHGALENQTFMGTNWAAFARDLLDAGGFDTRLGPGGTSGACGQETEAQRRLLARGVRAEYVPEAIAWHYLHREFLTPAWVLRRTYRHALEWGLRRTRDRKSPALPVLRAAVGRLNAHAKGFVLRMLGGEERNFEAAFHEAKWRGRWDGIWLGRRWDQLPQFRWPAANSQLPRAA